MAFTYRQDFILRLIERMVQFFARIAKLRDEKKYDEAQKALEDAYLELLGADRQWLRRLDSASAASLLGEPDSIKMMAHLVMEEGAINDGLGYLESAQLKYRYALELYLRAQLLWEREESECVEAIEELKARMAPQQVAAAYRTVLGSAVES